MVSCEIIKADKSHLNLLLANMRRMDIDECKAGGWSPGRALRQSYRSSFYVRSAFFDGKIAVIWGMCGPVIGSISHVWALTTPEVDKAPFTFAKHARKELDLALSIKPVLITHVWAEYTQAVRFFGLLGFQVYKPQPVGRDGALFHQILIARL